MLNSPFAKFTTLDIKNDTNLKIVTNDLPILGRSNKKQQQMTYQFAVGQKN